MTRESRSPRSPFFGGRLLLATIYGALSYLVTRRCIGFGIRMAPGATSSRSILRNVAALLIGGIVTGIGLSLRPTRLLSALLFGIEARDSATLAMSEAMIADVSLAASLLAGAARRESTPL